MRSSRWLPVAGWCVATATSIVLSSVALSPVLGAARAEEGALPDLGALPAAEVAVTTTSAAPVRSPEKTTPPAEEPSKSPAAKPSRTSPKPSPSKSSKAPEAIIEDGWTVTTGEDGVKTYVRSFKCDGGQVVIKMTSEGKVFLVTATPADGYTVQKTGSDVNMAIYFTSSDKNFIVHAQWFNNAPFVEISQIGA
ncbi:hypothetical protein [Actinoplanes rectilineatus]|uniref:hypothetical protein n=1 Tax=Actinoplanes rectilineatus TaxID=113571 RepID=UPI0005F2822C|nr:hypothetical protein [Actinoplanes rectilineatus]